MRSFPAWLVTVAVFIGFFSWTTVTYGSGPGRVTWPWWVQVVLLGLAALLIISSVRTRRDTTMAKDNRDRREEQKGRRREAAKARTERRTGDPGWRGDKRSPEGRTAEDEAKIQRGYTKSEDKDLQSPAGGTQREVWVKDNDTDKS